MDDVTNLQPQYKENLFDEIDHCLKRFPQEINAPPNFVSSVMSKIESIDKVPTPDSNIKRFRLPANMHGLRYHALAIASLALFLTVGVGMYSKTFHLNAPNATLAVSDTSYSQSILSPYHVDHSERTVTSSSQPLDLFVEKPANIDSVPSKTESSQIHTFSEPKRSNQPTSPITSQNSYAMPQIPANASTSTVLLNAPKIIEKSLFHYLVSNTEESVLRFKNAIANSKGELLDLVFQNSQGFSMVTLTIRIPKDRYNHFHTLINNIGTLLDSKDELQDITSAYKDVIQQLSIVESRIASSANAERGPLQKQADSYNKQIAEWDQAIHSKNLVIILEMNIRDGR